MEPDSEARLCQPIDVSIYSKGKLTPELRDWVLRQHTQEEIVAGLREARENSGPELGDLIREIEQGLQGRDQPSQ